MCVMAKIVASSRNIPPVSNATPIQNGRKLYYNNDQDNITRRGNDMAQGKNINLFLMDGEASGRIKCTLANWTGIAYKIPRTMLDKAREIDYLEQTGVYFLFGATEVRGDPAVYVGQAGIRKNGRGILCRLDEHRRDSEMDYWTEAVAFTTSNNSFGPTEISYLENRFCNIAKAAKRYFVKNGNDPSPGNITEEKESELEEFIAYAKLVMGALGYKVFEPLIERKSEIEVVGKTDEQPLLFFKSQKAEASGKRTSEGFVVMAGSTISLTTTRTCPENVLKFREKYAEKVDGQGNLTENLLFPSPSTAAGFVGGSSLSGNVMWKDEFGKTLKEIEATE